MRSDNSTYAPPGRWAWLRSQGLGVCCGLSTVLWPKPETKMSKPQYKCEQKR